MNVSTSELYKFLHTIYRFRFEALHHAIGFSAFWNSLEQRILHLSSLDYFKNESEIEALLVDHLSQIFTKDGLLKNISQLESGVYPNIRWRSENYNLGLLRKWNSQLSVQLPFPDNTSRMRLSLKVLHSDPPPKVGAPEKRIYRSLTPPVVFNPDGAPTLNFEFVMVAEQRGKRKKCQSQQNVKSVEQILSFHETHSKNQFFNFLIKNPDWLKGQIDAFTLPNQKDFLVHNDFTSHAKHNLDFVLSNFLLRCFNQDETINGVFQAYQQLLEFILSYLAGAEERNSNLHTRIKTVLSSHYCISLASIPECFMSEVFENEAQLLAWSVQLSVPLETVATPQFFAENKSLVVDTGFYSRDFQSRLLSSLGNLDTAFQGLIVQGDNADMLRLLQNRYRKGVDLIYIDPPYNTGEQSFAYKDSYPHTDWLSMMNERLKLARELLAPSGGFYVSINESELYHLKGLCDSHFGHANYLGNIAVQVRHPDRVLKADKHIQEVLEYLLIYQQSTAHQLGKRRIDNSNIDAYQWRVEILGRHLKEVRLGNKVVRIFSSDAYRMSKQSPSMGALKRINIRGTLRESNSSGRFYVNHIEPLKAAYPDHLFRVEKMGNDAFEDRFFWLPSAESKRKNGDYFQGVPLDFSPVKLRPFPNLWDFVAEFNHATHQGGVPFRNGKKPLEFLAKTLELAGLKDKPHATVLDFFGGSGSTAHAVMTLNQADGGSRCFILAEAGPHFDGTLKPRLINAMTTSKWSKNGPVFPLEGISSGFQVIRLASLQTTASAPAVMDEPLQSPDTVCVEHQLPEMATTHTSVVCFIDTFNILIGLRNRHCSRIHAFSDCPPISGGLNESFKGEVKCQFYWGQTKTNQDVAIMWGWYTGIPAVDLAFAKLWISELLPEVIKQPFEKLYLNGLTQAQISVIDTTCFRLCKIEPRLRELIHQG